MRIGLACGLVAFLGMVISPALCDDDEISTFRIPVRNQYARIYDLRQYVEKQYIADNRDEAVIERIRARLCQETGAYNQLLIDFRNARTRHGLNEEFLLLRESLMALSEITAMYSILHGEAHTPAPVTEQERSAIRERVFEEIGWYARDKLDDALRIEGLADILLAGSFEAARDEAVAQMRRHVRKAIADEMERLVGLRFYDTASLGEVLGMKARHLVERGIAKLLVKVTSNHLVISVATTVLLRWIGPKIMEALREKGNHEARVARSRDTIAAARDRLNALPGNADLGDVARALANAKRTINATHYLQSDLTRASKWALLTQVTDPMGDLTRTISLTNLRFLLDKPAYTEHYKLAERLIRDIRTYAKCTEDEVVEEDETDEPRAEFPPVFLIHTSERRVEDDDPEWEEDQHWYTSPERPAGNVVRYRDATGHVFARPTDVSFKIDRVLGPFINSEQRDPVFREIQQEQFIVTRAPWVPWGRSTP